MEKLKTEWGVSERCAKMYITDAFKFVVENREDLVNQNLLRLDGIVEQSMKEKNYKDAVRAIDTQNKMLGAYTEKIEISGDDEITLNFNL